MHDHFSSDTVTVECEREGDERSLSVVAECSASREIVNIACSIDDIQIQPCMYDITTHYTLSYLELLL